MTGAPPDPAIPKGSVCMMWVVRVAIPLILGAYENLA